MFLLRLAVRNLVRNMRRTVLTTTVIVAGVGVLILGESFIGGIEENIVKSTEDGLSGHVTLRPSGYPTQGIQHPVDELLTITDEVRKGLDAQTRAWTGRVIFAPTAVAGEDSLRVRAIGYDPERDEAVFPRTTWSIDGAWPDPAKDQALATPGVAKLLELEPGDSIVLQVRTHAGAMNALRIELSGIVRTANGAIDRLGVLMPRSLAHKLIAESRPTHVSVRLAHRDLAEAARLPLKALFGDAAEAITWHDDARELLRMQGIRRKALNILVFILLALAAFSIANTILMAAHERVREIGTLRALGMTEQRVVRMFLTEGALMGLVGGLLGAAWGGGLVAWWSVHPIDLTAAMASGQMDIQFSAFLYLPFDSTLVAGSVLFGLVVASAASIFPARVASRMLPADAVRA